MLWRSKTWQYRRSTPHFLEFNTVLIFATSVIERNMECRPSFFSDNEPDCRAKLDKVFDFLKSFHFQILWTKQWKMKLQSLKSGGHC